MSVQVERSMTALIEKYSVEKIKCLINTRDVALLDFMNNYNRQPIDLSNEFFACKIQKLELYKIRNTSMTKEEITESIRTDFRYAGTTVSEIIIN